MNKTTLDAQIAALLPVELHFVRTHTRGALAGMTTSDSLRFESAERAAEWVDGVNRNHAKGTVEYSVARA